MPFASTGGRASPVFTTKNKVNADKIVETMAIRRNRFMCEPSQTLSLRRRVAAFLLMDCASEKHARYQFWMRGCGAEKPQVCQRRADLSYSSLRQGGKASGLKSRPELQLDPVTLASN